MAPTPYRTLDSPGEAMFRVKGSRFIGRVSPVSDVAAADEIRDTITAEHPDATHVVPAYRIRDNPLREYQDDAGEPGGSAGPPMLNVLQGEELVNVLAIVVRYYGGTNLGIGGLVRAYSTAVKRALADTDIVERSPHARFTITIDYADSGAVRSILAGSDASFDAEYAEHVVFDVAVPVGAHDALRDRILSATSGRATFVD